MPEKYNSKILDKQDDLKCFKINLKCPFCKEKKISIGSKESKCDKEENFIELSNEFEIEAYSTKEFSFKCCDHSLVFKFISSYDINNQKKKLRNNSFIRRMLSL